MSALAVDPEALRAAGAVLLRRAARLAELADGLGGGPQGWSTGDEVVDAALADLVEAVALRVEAHADEVAGAGARLLAAADAYALADGQDPAPPGPVRR